ncbi:unnamed protein product, partial [Didymodactylos carnosus]
MDANDVEDFMLEIQHLESKIEEKNEVMKLNPLKFPVLAPPESIKISQLFGKLMYKCVDENGIEHEQKKEMKSQVNIENEMTRKQPQYNDKGDSDDDYIIVNKNDVHVKRLTDGRKEKTTSTTLTTIKQKHMAWSIEYNSIPHFLQIWSTQLYIVDKYGYMEIKSFDKSNDLQKCPQHVKTVRLFDNFKQTGEGETNDETIIDSFTIHKYYIIVFKRLKQELKGKIHLFKHNGQCLKACIAHDFPSREFTIDNDLNCLFTIDQRQCSIYRTDLLAPNDQLNDIDYINAFNNRSKYIEFRKDFVPLHMVINQKSIAVLDKHQHVQVLDKKTKTPIFEFSDCFIESHYLWNIGLFNDNSLLLKLDEVNSIKTIPKHKFFQLSSINKQPIQQFEEVDAFGLIVTLTNEILIGIRANSKGIIKCYIEY